MSNNYINLAQTEELGSAGTMSKETGTAENSTTSGPGEGLTSFLPLIIMFVAMYFLLMRPQMKKQKEHQKMVKEIKRGDKVILTSGIIGTIVKMEEETQLMQVEIAHNVKVRMLKSSISEIFKENQNAASSAEPKDSIKDVTEISTDK